jgi:hypothetical protein
MAVRQPAVKRWTYCVKRVEARITIRACAP